MGKKSKNKKLKNKKILKSKNKSVKIKRTNSRDVKSVMTSERNNGHKILLTTMTKETYMLARIHYALFDKEKIQQIFSQLRCMEYDNIQDRWVWLYEAEAKKIKFKGAYRDIPKERRPIILGSFFSKSNEIIYLNVNSFDRAKKAVEFFDKYIPINVAKVTDITVLNKVFDFYDGNLPKHEDYFDKGHIKINNPEEIMDELKNVTSSIENPIKKLEKAMTLMETITKQPLPEIERFPLNFYEDGIIGFSGSLTMRETVALQHWNGNKNYSFNDLMEQIIPKMPPIKME